MNFSLSGIGTSSPAPHASLPSPGTGPAPVGTSVMAGAANMPSSAMPAGVSVPSAESAIAASACAPPVAVSSPFSMGTSPAGMSAPGSSAGLFDAPAASARMSAPATSAASFFDAPAAASGPFFGMGTSAFPVGFGSPPPADAGPPPAGSIPSSGMSTPAASAGLLSSPGTGSLPAVSVGLDQPPAGVAPPTAGSAPSVGLSTPLATGAGLFDNSFGAGMPSASAESLSFAPVGVGPPPAGIGPPPPMGSATSGGMSAPTASAGMFDVPTGVGAASAGMRSLPVAPVGVGPPPAGIGPPPAGVGAPPPGVGPPPFGVGPPPAAVSPPHAPANVSQPSGSLGQAAGLFETSAGLGLSAGNISQITQPPLGVSPPPVGLGQPAAEKGMWPAPAPATTSMGIPPAGMAPAFDGSQLGMGPSSPQANELLTADPTTQASGMFPMASASASLPAACASSAASQSETTQIPAFTQQAGGSSPANQFPASVPSASKPPAPTPNLFSQPSSGQQPPQQSIGTVLRPPCAMLSFSVNGKLLKALPSGSAKEHSVSELLRQNLGEWHRDLEEFPGPFGRVESSTSELLLQYLRKLSDQFERGVKTSCALETATSHPNSAALACHFIACLIESNGRVQSDDFWSRFSPVLAKRALSIRPVGDPTVLQEFCARLCRGEVSGALDDACKNSLWSHAMAASKLVAPDSADSILMKFRDALLKAGQTERSLSLSENEQRDPAVRALMILYETLGKGNVPEMSEEMLTGWPAFVAMFSLLLRPCEYRSLAISFIESLAARLAAKGDAFGAHVCYLVTGERSLEAVDAPSSLVCLIGVEHRSPKNFPRLLEPLALQLSEAYEYAIRCGNADALCPTIQPFKLAHAMLLADAGLVDKARKYMTLLQAFVKAVPQNRLSDAFRSSMREFNEVLNPSAMSAPGGAAPADAPRVGKMVKNLFRGFAETTGLAVKPTPPPALAADDDDQASQPSSFHSQQQQPFLAHSNTPSQAPFQAHAQPAMPLGPPGGSPSHSPSGFAPSGPAQSPCGFAPHPPSPSYSSFAQSGPGPSISGFAPSGPSASPPSFTSSCPSHSSGQSLPSGGFNALSPMAGSTFAPAANAPSYPSQTAAYGAPPPPGMPPADSPPDDKPKRPDRMDYGETLESDPLLNAGKAVLGFGKSLFSAMKGGGNEQQQQKAGSSDTDSKPNAFYYDKEKGRWRQHGVDDEPDASQFDPMTGKKLMPKVTEPPPPPPPMGGAPPPMGGPPMSGSAPPSGNPYAGGGLQRGAGAAALYVNPMAPSMGGPPPGGGPGMGGNVQSPCFNAGAPPVGMQQPQAGPLSSPFGGPAGNAPMASPFGGQAGGVRSSPFG
eukprot:TRINITY_DN72049_c0_g1_i1.p1 TRINITY_DN72049_c0_g1~~TRINITY_DN72049_c0_g1_i1.p1  ORF type:complete len:1446 (+),score=260.86 TRINITY_DN72049_c0_g1_i1:300-4340(+)